MQLIECDKATLFQQAMMTAQDFLSRAVRDIDKELGQGYAKKNPALVAEYMRACGRDWSTAMSSAASDNLVDRLGGLVNGLELIASAVRNRMPPVVEEEES